MNGQRRLRDETMDTVEAHLREQRYAVLGVSGWSLSGGDEPRLVGTDDIAGEQVVVDVRVAKYENAGRFRGWLTIGSPGARAMLAERPAGWRFYTLVVGLLPDGMPWWAALWDMSKVRRNWGLAEEMSDGYWYRLNPGLLQEPDRPLVYDFLQTTMGLEVPTAEALPGLVTRMVSWEESISECPDDELVAVDQVMLRVRRMIRSERERRETRVAV